MRSWSSVIPRILWLVGIRESLVHSNIFNISRPLKQVCAPVSVTAQMQCVRRLVFHSRFAQIWRGIWPSMTSQFSEMVVVLEGSYRICPYSMWGTVLPIILAPIHRIPGFPFLYYWEWLTGALLKYSLTQCWIPSLIYDTLFLSVPLAHN